MNRLMQIYVILSLFAISSILCAETIAYQGFEGEASEGWAYSASAPGSGYWGIMDDEFGGATAHSGDQYWASWLLGSAEGILTFANQNLSPGYLYSVSFHYYTRLLNAPAEYTRYALSYDEGLSWSEWTALLPNTQAWTESSIEIPAQASQVMLKLSTAHNGTGKYAHWDGITLNRQPTPPLPPQIFNVQIAQNTDGSGLVDIFYDLFDANYDPCTVTLLISDDAGASYSITPNPINLSGDIGAAINPGPGKHIVWNAGNEDITFEGDQYRFRLGAEDGTNPQVATPLIDPAGGTFDSPIEVTISCATANAVIRYTIDGSEPGPSSALYTEEIPISSDTTLKAKAFRQDWQPSETAVAVYEGFMPDNFVFVEGGTFNNGTSDVTLSSFYIDKYELTQAAYEAVMGVNPSNFGGNPNRPVEQVSWFNAIEYCNRRSMQEGLTPCYSYSTYGTNPDDWPAGWNTDYSNHTNVSCNWTANGYRLPTEMEWMFAAKGGNHSQGYTYSGSNDINAVAWYSSNSSSRTWDVGLKNPNELGTYDMSGNVWEWVWDIYGSYPSGSQNNPTGANSGSARVLRGGSWSHHASSCTVSLRSISVATYTDIDLGFRIIRISP